MTAITIKRAFNNTTNLISAAKEKSSPFAYGVKKFFYNLITLGFGKSMETARAERRENEIVHVAFDVLSGLPKDHTDLDKAEFKSKTLHTNFDKKYQIIQEGNDLCLYTGNVSQSPLNGQDNFDKDNNSRTILKTFYNNKDFLEFKTKLDPIKENPIDPIKENPIDPIKENPIDPIKENPIYKGLEQQAANTRLKDSNWDTKKNKNVTGTILSNFSVKEQSTQNKYFHQLTIMTKILPNARQSGNFKDLIIKLKYLSSQNLLGIVKDSNINWSYAVLKTVSSLPQIHESEELIEELTKLSEGLPQNLRLNLQKKEQQVSTSFTIDYPTIDYHFSNRESNKENISNDIKNMQKFAQTSTNEKELASLITTINSIHQKDIYYENSLMKIGIAIAQNPNANLATLQQLHEIAIIIDKNETHDVKDLLVPILINPNMQKDLWDKFSQSKASTDFFNEIYPTIKDNKNNVALLAQNPRVSTELLNKIFSSNNKNIKILVALASNPNIPKDLLDKVTVQMRKLQ